MYIASFSQFRRGRARVHWGHFKHLRCRGVNSQAIRSATHKSACFACRRRILHGQVESPRPPRSARSSAQFGKGSIMKLGKNDKSMDVETISTGSLGPRHRARRRRSAARPGGGDLRAGILGQNDAGAAHRRRGAEARRHLRLRRRRARARSRLCAQARGQCRRPADLAAGRRRAGAGNHRYAGALRRGRRAGGRFGRGPDAAGRARRRDGRRAAGLAGAADEPGAAQAHRLDLQIAHHGHLHQPDPHEDRRDVRHAGDHHAAATR